MNNWRVHYLASENEAFPYSSQGKRLRIALVVHQFVTHSLGGVEIHTYNLARALQKKGHWVRVIFPEYDDSSPAGIVKEGVYDGLPISIMTVPASGEITRQFKNDALGKAFLRYISHLEVDVVHFQHLIGFTGSCLKTCSDQGVPTVMTVHDAWLLCQQSHLIRFDGAFCAEGPESVENCVACLIGRYRGLPLSQHRREHRQNLAFRYTYLKECLAGIDGMLICSSFIGNLLSKHGVSCKKMILSPLGLNPFHSIPKRNDDNNLRLTFLGTIYFTKGLDILIRAFNELEDWRTELHIWGKIVDERYFHESLSQLETNKKAIYHGGYGRDDLPWILAHSDVAVVPSRGESYSFVIRECLQGGVPVVAANVGAIPEIITDGANGLLFKQGDHRDLASKIRYILCNPWLVSQLRENIGCVHNIADEVKTITMLYGNIVDANRASDGTLDKGCGVRLTQKISRCMKARNRRAC